jgi:hypothetical protein
MKMMRAQIEGTGNGLRVGLGVPQPEPRISTFIMKKHIATVVAAFSLSVFVPAVDAAVFTIFDNTFAPSQWSLEGLAGSNAGTASASVIGGLSGNGREVRIGGFGSVTYQIENYKTNASFSPALGSATGFTLQIWQQVTGGNGTFQSTRFVASQGSSFYASSIRWEPPIFSGNWQKFETSVAPSDFTLMRGDGPAPLDLSETAAPIRFGYMSFSQVFIPSPATPRNSFFNVDVTYTPIPEASTGGLLLMGLLWSGRRQRVDSSAG